MGGCAVKTTPEVVEAELKQALNLAAFTRSWTQTDMILSHRATSGAYDSPGVPELPQTCESEWVKVVGSLAPHAQVEFEEKYTVSTANAETHGWTFAKSCRKGYKPGTENQDDFAILTSENCLIAGVFDGHGAAGHCVSHFVQNYLASLVARITSASQQDIKQTWEGAFYDCQRKVEEAARDKAFDCVLSGTTATVATVSEGKLVVGNVGDSMGILARRNGEIVEMTINHRPDMPEERKRIEQKGGVVRTVLGDPTPRLFLRHRDLPGLAMSRSLGDTLSKDLGASAKPDIRIFPLSSEEEFIILGSDGIWDFVESAEAVEVVRRAGKEAVQQAADSLTKLAWSRWASEDVEYVDDLTVVIVYLQDSFPSENVNKSQ